MSMRIATALLAFLFLLSLAACSSGTRRTTPEAVTQRPCQPVKVLARKAPARKVPARGELDGSGGHQKKAETVGQMRKRHRRH